MSLRKIILFSCLGLLGTFGSCAKATQIESLLELSRKAFDSCLRVLDREENLSSHLCSEEYIPTVRGKYYYGTYEPASKNPDHFTYMARYYTDLDCHDFQFGQIHLERIKELTHLTYLNLSSTNIKYIDGYSVLNNLLNLNELVLYATNTGFRDRDVLKDISFHKMDKMTKFNYSGNVVRNEDLKRVAKIPGLRTLVLDFVSWGEKPDFSSLKISTLQTLSIRMGRMALRDVDFPEVVDYSYDENDSLSDLVKWRGTDLKIIK